MHAKRAQLEFLAGNWDEADVLAGRAQTLATESGDHAAESLAAWAAVLVPAARGEPLEREIGALDAISAVFEAHVAPVRLGLAEAAAAQGRHRAVLDALAR